MKWIIYVGFNVLFGLFAGFITSRVFNSKGISTNEVTIRKSQRKMILQVAAATLLSGLCWMTIFIYTRQGFIAIGLMFGITTTLLTHTFMYLGAKFMDAKRNSSNSMKANSALKIVLLIKSLSFIEFMIVGVLTLLYGFIFLLIPGLGILWGYLMNAILLIDGW